MYRFLEAANLFSEYEDYPERITNHLIENGILTPNVRQDAGKPQAWRDYQQVLAELGLIYSTKFTEKLFLTPIALMWLDGSIGYSELITTQTFRYQYPNGHKQDISSAVKDELSQHRRNIPDTRTELDAINGVCIKPAVLIFRVLAEIFNAGDSDPHISCHECLHALVPVKTNSLWPEAIKNLEHLRKRGIPPSDGRALRHVAEWFRLLNCTDLFSVDRGILCLTNFAKENIDALLSFCEKHEGKRTFWLEVSDKQRMALSWFNHYGSPDISKMWFKPQIFHDIDYIIENYIDGIDIDSQMNDNPELNFQIDLNEINLDVYEKGAPDIPRIDVRKIYSSYKKRDRSTNLHHKIVKIAASKLIDDGYKVYEDNKSVDILAFKEEIETIVEVKTITPRNISSRIRLGTGQLSEYRYRREIQTTKRPASVLLLSSNIEMPEWYMRYLVNDIQIGLVTYSEGDIFTSRTDGILEKTLEKLR
jgi:hypothetical protein